MSVNRDFPQRGGSFNRPGVPGRRDNRYQSAPIVKLEADYLKNSYFDKDGEIKCELLTTKAREIADIFKKSGITSTQIRGFFTQARSIERKVDNIKDNYYIRADIQKMQSLVAYYVGRGKDNKERECRENLKSFIDQNTKLVNDSKRSFKNGFMSHFESVVAYLKYISPR